jgi:hypothetical protein
MDLLRLPPFISGIVILSLTFLGATIQGLAVTHIARLSGTLLFVIARVGWTAMLVERFASRETERRTLMLVRVAGLRHVCWCGVRNQETLAGIVA